MESRTMVQSKRILTLEIRNLTNNIREILVAAKSRGIIKNNKSAVGSTALLLLKRGKFMKKIYKRKLCRFLFVYVYTIPFACDQIVSKF